MVYIQLLLAANFLNGQQLPPSSLVELLPPHEQVLDMLHDNAVRLEHVKGLQQVAPSRDYHVAIQQLEERQHLLSVARVATCPRAWYRDEADYRYEVRVALLELQQAGVLP